MGTKVLEALEWLHLHLFGHLHLSNKGTKGQKGIGTLIRHVGKMGA